MLRGVDLHLAEDDARLMAHAAFGLLNSTPHSVRSTDGRSADRRRSREVLGAMTAAALRIRHEREQA